LSISASQTQVRVRVVEAGPVPEGWTGKNNAAAAGSRLARGAWFLFTDADTLHLPRSLARALAEAEDNQADMLSYSPEQMAVTFWEMAALPVVFAELVRQYPPAKVSDPNSSEAAANGQYILIKREAYEAVGGHAAIAGEILEDVALARRVKASGRRLRFRYAEDAVRTRMYRNFHQLRDGWTKNLALLFPKPGRLAMRQLAIFVGIIGTGSVVIRSLVSGMPREFWPALLWPQWSVKAGFAIPNGIGFLWMVAYLFREVRAARFPRRVALPALFGFPFFSYLLLRSMRAHAKGKVGWKGRTYSDGRKKDIPNAKAARSPLLKEGFSENQQLTTGF